MSAKYDAAPITVARIRNNKMTAVRRFTNREVDGALAYVAAVRAAGDSANVTVLDNADGSGISSNQAQALKEA